MGIKQSPEQKWSVRGMVIGAAWLIAGYLIEKLFDKAIEDTDGAMTLVLSILLAPWMPALIVVSCFVAWGVASLRLKKEQQATAEGYHSQFINAWDGLKTTRRIFEKKIDTLYGTWSKNPSDLSAIKNLIDKAGYPVGLPLKEGEHIWQYAVEATREWEGARRALSDFCMAVYVRQDNRLMPNEEERNAFDEIRIDLSKFWDFWGAKCFNEKVMDEKKMLATIRGQGWMILLLIYLEVARAYHYKTTDVGKSWLFLLGREVAGLNNR